MDVLSTKRIPASVVVKRATDVPDRIYEYRVLDFDIESRPLGWLGGDYVHQEPTVIACAWVDDPSSIEVYTITKRKGSEIAMLKAFKKRYDEAGIVTGHYIRGYDLPQIQAALVEWQLPLLGQKLTHDTKNDLVKFQGVSKSQENLGAMLGLEAPKVQMNAAKWRRANRLTDEGIKEAIERAAGDVIQHIELRAKLIELDALAPPSLWVPGGGGTAKYTP